MLALSIRQPFAELILRGIKTIEYRSRATRMIGRRFYIYASRGKVWSNDLAVGQPPPPLWMIELAEQIKIIEPGVLAELPRGLIVGSAIIEKVTPPVDAGGLFQWHLGAVERARRLRKPRGHPQPVWFEPF